MSVRYGEVMGMGYHIVYPGKPIKGRKHSKWTVIFALSALLAVAYPLIKEIPIQRISSHSRKTVEAVESWAETVKPEEKIEEIVEAFYESVLEVERQR
jgi:hypothetical protein